jgi:hypothetical protein
LTGQEALEMLFRLRDRKQKKAGYRDARALPQISQSEFI